MNAVIEMIMDIVLLPLEIILALFGINMHNKE